MFLDKIILDATTSRDKSNFSVKDKIFFFKELGYLLAGGVGILEAVDTINQNTDNYALKDITRQIAEHMRGGKSLSYALIRQSEYFDEGDVTIIKSGEASGNLATILQSIANEYQFIHKMKNKYKSALTYPIMLIIIATAAIIALFAFVLPAIFDIVHQFPDMELPTMTIILQKISSFMVNNWLSMLIGGAFVVLIATIVFSTAVGQVILFRTILGIPVLGKITQSYYLIKFSRYTKIMLEAGMNYVETFRLLKSILNLPLYDPLLDNIISTLSEGNSLHSGIKDEIELIPSTVSALIKVGEQTANLPNTFENIINIYEDDLQTNINNLSKVIEPVMLVAIGGVIVVVAMGVFGIITNIMDTVQV